MLGPPAYGTELRNPSVTWVPDDPAVHAPPSSFSSPHRPPIA
jgi:hypothetical protein